MFFRNDVLCKEPATEVNTETSTTAIPVTSGNSTRNPRTQSTQSKEESNNTCTCLCGTPNNRWAYLYNRNLSIDQLRCELKGHIQELSNSISVNRKTTKRFLATKISVYDGRTSAASLGLFGALIISLVIGTLLTIDILSCCGSIQRKKRRKHVHAC